MPTAESNATDNQPKNDRLYFSFAGSKWSDVIAWLAETADLALHVDDLPKGTFTYSDSQGFTLQEAIDRINLFLLPEGFTLIRSGRLLSVIDLNNPRSVKQLETLSRLVKPEQLDELPDHDLVKCLFPLGELEANEAIEELSPLNLIIAPGVFNKTQQILLTDTAGKLKLARDILTAFRPETLKNGTVVRSFTLDHVTAEDVLSVARPHLGLATGEMIGIDVSISADVLGENIFVTGVEDKVQLIENLISEIDFPEKQANDANNFLQSYRVAGGNVEMVYNVLQTLLSGEELRLSIDQAAQSIVAFASEDIHRQIAETVQKLQASEAQFTVIPLRHVDPYLVITLLEQMLDLDQDSTDTMSSYDGDRDRDRRRRDWRDWRGEQQVSASVSPPRIDADPAGMRLFVRGTPEQIDQIKKIVSELDVPDSTVVGGDGNLRIIPLTGKPAMDAIETAARFWQKDNSLIFYPPENLSLQKVKEQVIAEDEADEDDEATESAPVPPRNQLGSGRILSRQLNTELPVVQIQLTERGILLQSEDSAALDQFEQILRTVVGPANTIAAAPVIYYLKYAKPDEAIRMLAQLLDGGDSARDSDSSTLVNGLVLGSSDMFLGSFISSADGTLTLTYGSTTVVADTRLNRLIAQGTPTELEQVEAYLKIIDKDRSITSIETYGRSHVIELVNVDANEVAETLRQAYLGRVMGETGARGRQQGQPGQRGNGNPREREQRQERDDDRDNRDRNEDRDNNRPGPGRANTPPSNEPRMTIAVHEPSNSLIVTAPEPLFQEVKELCELIDSRSVETVEILKISRPLAADIQAILSGESPAGAANGGVPRSPFAVRPGGNAGENARREPFRSR